MPPGNFEKLALLRLNLLHFLTMIHSLIVVLIQRVDNAPLSTLAYTVCHLY